ncbi:MAG: adenylyl-sulfate kinase [Actinomycetota bacterium]|nr:adenylyl-sulfate kinase [Actinomycetota bacterium]
MTWHRGEVTRERRWSSLGGAGATVWFTGLSGSGKSTIAAALEERLVAEGRPAYLLDGDNLRHGLNGDLGFDPAARDENVRRTGEVARLFADAGLVALVSLVSPYAAARDAVRAVHEADGLPFLEVWVSTSPQECARRDPKGLWARSARGELSGLTGVDAPYEAPELPELELSGDTGVSESVERVAGALERSAAR